MNTLSKDSHNIFSPNRLAIAISGTASDTGGKSSNGPSIKTATFCLLAVIIPVISLTGCTRERDKSVEIISNLDAAASQTDNLTEAFHFLDQMAMLDRNKAAKEILYELNAWNATAAADQVTWERPKLLDTLPGPMKAYPSIADLEQAKYTAADVEYLYQCRIMSKVSDWVVQKPYRDPIFKPWLDQQSTQMSPEDFVKLEYAMKLFDWTVRNIQLDGQASDIESTMADPQSIQPTGGLGYTQLPWQTLLFGRGDALSRGRVFGELARQEQISTAWIALPSKSDSGPVQIWLQGVAIANQIYLFDPRLGLPLPGPDQTGVATLEQAKSDESILRRAKLPGRYDYAVEAKDVKDLTALIDVEPSSMSRRIVLLQSSLTGDQRMQINTSADAVAEDFKKHANIKSVSMWSLPILTLGFSDFLRQELEKQSAFTAQYQITYGLFLMDTPVARARNLHLKGQFENTIDKMGALTGYMNCRIPDDSLDRLPFDENVQKELDMNRGRSEPLEQFEARLAQVQVLYRGAKVDGSYMLGLLHFDLDNPDSTINWLEKRTLPLEGIERWKSSAWYNLARAYELKGNVAKVDELYRETPTAQEAGNRIRLRLFQSQQGQAGATDSETAAD